jgi:hypothetical protein
MKPARTYKPRIRRGRSGLELLPAGPRDPDVVRAKALAHPQQMARSQRIQELTDLSRAGGPPDVFQAGYGLFHLEGVLP